MAIFDVFEAILYEDWTDLFPSEDPGDGRPYIKNGRLLIGPETGGQVTNETLTGAVNGINATFTTAHNFVPGTVEVFLNGLAQKIVNDFQTIGQNTIVLVNSPGSGERITANYLRAE